MRKITFILLLVSISTTSMAASCHKEASDARYEFEQQDGRQPASVEQQQQEWKEHKEYLDKVDKGKK